MIDTLFYLTAGVALLSATLAVTGFNIAHSLLHMVITMVAISFIYVLLGAPFPAALQIIVYAGAIIILFVFVTMMLHEGEITLNKEKALFRRHSAMLPFILSGILFCEMAFMLSHPGVMPEISGSAPISISLRDLGLKLYGPYLLLVEMASLLLISALVGAFHIGRRKQEGRS